MVEGRFGRVLSEVEAGSGVGAGVGAGVGDGVGVGVGVGVGDGVEVPAARAWYVIAAGPLMPDAETESVPVAATDSGKAYCAAMVPVGRDVIVV